MSKFYLTRLEYDQMLQQHEKWMNKNWSKFTRMWLLGGVKVTGQDKLIKELMERKNQCKLVK